MTALWPPPPPGVKTAIAIQQAAFGTTVPVSAKMPKVRPDRFVRVSILPGRRVDQVSYRPRILVELFGLDVESVESMYATASTAFLNAASTIVNGVFVRCWDDEQ